MTLAYEPFCRDVGAMPLGPGLNRSQSFTGNHSAPEHGTAQWTYVSGAGSPSVTTIKPHMGF